MTSAFSSALVTLGSNIDAEANLPLAVRFLAARVRVEGVSRVYETEPIGPVRRPRYLNAAVRLLTDMPPMLLRDTVLRPIEDALGRVRTADKHAPRTIDLDLAIYDDVVVDDPENDFHLPDPGILRHAYLALPLADVAPDVALPGDGRTLATIAATLHAAADAEIRHDVSLWPPHGQAI